MFNALKHNAFANRLLRRTPLVYARALREIESYEALNASERSAGRDALISAILREARKLPGYAHAPGSDDLRDWPILTKRKLLGNESRYATRSFFPSPTGETGGTTGQPLRLQRSYYNVVFEQACIDSLCARSIISPQTARVAVLRGDSIQRPDADQSGYWIDEGPRKRVYSAHHITRHNAASYVRSLLAYAPDILFCYPSSLAALLAHVEPLDGLRIPLVFSSSEVLHPQTMQDARERLHCDVIDYYGHAERIISAYAFNDDGYRFISAYGHAELVPCGDGKARIIATSLRANGQVFVRYDTGDLARIGERSSDDLQKIALGLLPFDGIEGRDSEYIELDDGRRIIGLNHVPRGAYGAASVQLHQAASNAVDIYMVPGQSFGQNCCETIVENFYSKFPVSVEVRLWTCDAPVREPNGKAPLLLKNPVVPENRAPLRFLFTPECAA
ncbi:MAG: hypothetical protein KDJ29_08260 [Hyphomicrobiales bacterium]|nr:hypothetical protein [Hyphomicrobiales bacterium]